MTKGIFLDMFACHRGAPSVNQPRTKGGAKNRKTGRHRSDYHGYEHAGSFAAFSRGADAGANDRFLVAELSPR